MTEPPKNPGRFTPETGQEQTTERKTEDTEHIDKAELEVQPYRGQDAFAEYDTDFFFGRERAVNELLKKMEHPPSILTVLGPSGSGKSSIIRAGLIPQLRKGSIPGSDHWEIISIHQCDNPFEQLASEGLEGALEEGLINAVEAGFDRNPGYERLILILDQFEEFLLNSPEILREKFEEQLADLSYFPSTTVVLVIQDGFYGDLLTQTPDDLKEELRPGLVWVHRSLNKDELRDMVQKPAEVAGLRFESDFLVRSIVDAAEEIGRNISGSGLYGEKGGLPEQIEAEEISDNRELMDRAVKHLGDPEADHPVSLRNIHSTVLPLLEDALTEMWQRRQGETLTHEAFSEIGRLTERLNSWAENCYRHLSSKEERDLAKRILTDLAKKCPQGFLSMRCGPMPITELYSEGIEDAKVQRMVQLLTKSRLLVTTVDENRRQNAEIIHADLLRWSRLEDWIKETAQTHR